MIVHDSWWSNGSACSTIIDYHEPFDQGFRPRTEVGRSSFQHRAALTWNLFPDDIKNYSKLAIFKRKLKENKNILKSISFTKASCSISSFLECEKNGLKKHLPALFPREFFHVCIINK